MQISTRAAPPPGYSAPTTREASARRDRGPPFATPSRGPQLQEESHPTSPSPPGPRSYPPPITDFRAPPHRSPRAAGARPLAFAHASTAGWPTTSQQRRRPHFAPARAADTPPPPLAPTGTLHAARRLHNPRHLFTPLPRAHRSRQRHPLYGRAPPALDANCGPLRAANGDLAGAHHLRTQPLQSPLRSAPTTSTPSSPARKFQPQSATCPPLVSAHASTVALHRHVHRPRMQTRVRHCRATSPTSTPHQPVSPSRPTSPTCKHSTKPDAHCPLCSTSAKAIFHPVPFLCFFLPFSFSFLLNCLLRFYRF